jgi:hypothetical protein
MNLFLELHGHADNSSNTASKWRIIVQPAVKGMNDSAQIQGLQPLCQISIKIAKTRSPAASSSRWVSANFANTVRKVLQHQRRPRHPQQ